MISETTLIKGGRLIGETCMHVEAGEGATRPSVERREAPQRGSGQARAWSHERSEASQNRSGPWPPPRPPARWPVRTFVEVSTWPTR